MRAFSVLSALALLLYVGRGATQDERPFDVWSIVCARDGSIVAASGGMWDAPGEIGVWDLATRKPLARFTEDLGVASIALSPDARLLASGSWTGHIRVREWAAARQIADFEVAGVARIAFSPDGQLLASATEKHACQLWDIPGRKLLADLEGDLFRFHCVLFAPDGKRLLAGGGDWKRGGTNQVTIWDVATRKQVLKLVGHENAVICMTYSPDARTIATGGVDTTIRLWDAATGTPLQTLRGHRHWVESLAYSADGKTLLSSSHDGTIRVWDVATGLEKDQVRSMPGSVRAIQFTPDHSALLAGGAQKTLKIFDATGHKELAVLWSREEAPLIAMEALPETKPAPESNVGSRSRLWLMLIIAGAAAAAALGLWHRQQRRNPAQQAD
jgi:WD40 repeat protein